MRSISDDAECTMKGGPMTECYYFGAKTQKCDLIGIYIFNGTNYQKESILGLCTRK